MKKLLLERIVKEEEYTLGKLYINGKYFSDTIEDKVRLLNSYEDKIYSKTAIPIGVYKVVLSYSNRFKCILPEVLNVMFFKGIRIHSGNTAEDSSGCILVGINRNPKEGKIYDSRKTLKKLMEILQGDEEITLEIK